VVICDPKLSPHVMVQVVSAPGPGSAARVAYKNATGRTLPLPTPRYPEQGVWEYANLFHPTVRVNRYGTR
jgi:hypothetical protein